MAKGEKFALEVYAGLAGAIHNRLLSDWDETPQGEFIRRTQDGVLIALVYRNKKKWLAAITAEGCGLERRVVSQHGTSKRAMAVLDVKLPRYGWKLKEDPEPS